MTGKIKPAKWDNSQCPICARYFYNANKTIEHMRKHHVVHYDLLLSNEQNVVNGHLVLSFEPNGDKRFTAKETSKDE